MNKIVVRIEQNEVKAKLAGDLVLSQNYPTLTNLPKINGVTLTGDKTAAELSLLSARAADYESSALSLVKDAYYVPVIGEGRARKVSLASIAHSKISTVNEIPTDMDVGDYIFLKKGE